MLICAMFATRLSPPRRGMCAGALTVALAVVGFSAGVALPCGRFPRLLWDHAATGWGLGGRGFGGRGLGGGSFGQLFRGRCDRGGPTVFLFIAKVRHRQCRANAAHSQRQSAASVTEIMYLARCL